MIISLFMLFSPSEKMDELFFQRIEEGMQMLEMANNAIWEEEDVKILFVTQKSIILEDIGNILSSYFLPKRVASEEGSLLIIQSLFQKLESLQRSFDTKVLQDFRQELQFLRRSLSEVKLYPKSIDGQKFCPPKREPIHLPKPWKRRNCQKSNSQNPPCRGK